MYQGLEFGMNSKSGYRQWQNIYNNINSWQGKRLVLFLFSFCTCTCMYVTVVACDDPYLKSKEIDAVA